MMTPVLKAPNPKCQDQLSQVLLTKLMERFLFAGFVLELKRKAWFHLMVNLISSYVHVSVLAPWE